MAYLIHMIDTELYTQQFFTCLIYYSYRSNYILIHIINNTGLKAGNAKQALQLIKMCFAEKNLRAHSFNYISHVKDWT